MVLGRSLAAYLWPFERVSGWPPMLVLPATIFHSEYLWKKPASMMVWSLNSDWFKFNDTQNWNWCIPSSVFRPTSRRDLSHGDSWDTLTQPLQPVWNATREVNQWETRKPGRERLGDCRCCQEEQHGRAIIIQTGTNEEWDVEASIVWEGWEHPHAQGGRSAMINRYKVFKFLFRRTSKDSSG